MRRGPFTGEWLILLRSATVAGAGWADLVDPILVRAGDGFIAELQPNVPHQSELPPRE